MSERKRSNPTSLPARLAHGERRNPVGGIPVALTVILQFLWLVLLSDEGA
jgi:hypothetical protein